MPVKIRLMRIGAKKRPFFRVVAVDEQKKRTGAYLELLGTYNPLTTPKEIILIQDRIDEWIKKGAQPSDGFLRITGKAPQRPPRKPKKAQKAPVETSATQQQPKAPDGASSETESTSAEDAVSAESGQTPVEAASEVVNEKSAPEETATETTPDAPVESETSLKEAKHAESAKKAAETLIPAAKEKEAVE